MNIPTLKYEMTIGARRVMVANVEDASRQYQLIRDAAERDDGPSAESLPEGRVTIGGNTYRVSYNGRVWFDSQVIVEAAKHPKVSRYSLARLEGEIESWQDVQKRNPPASDLWQRASRELHVLCGEAARREMVL